MSHVTYKVMVDDNFHFSDGSKPYQAGEYDTYEEAVAKCHAIVDTYLHSALKPNITADELYQSYTLFGEDPFIVSEQENNYSSLKYAQKRCEELTAQR